MKKLVVGACSIFFVSVTHASVLKNLAVDEIGTVEDLSGNAIAAIASTPYYTGLLNSDGSLTFTLNEVSKSMDAAYQTYKAVVNIQGNILADGLFEPISGAITYSNCTGGMICPQSPVAFSSIVAQLPNSLKTTISDSSSLTVEWFSVFEACAPEDTNCGGAIFKTAAVPPPPPPPVPVPAAAWLFGSGLLGLAAVSRRHK